MKAKIKIEQEIEITKVRVVLPVRYDEEDIPNTFPLRKGDKWEATIDIDTGRILDWPLGQSGEMYMNVCDEGCYYLIGADGQEIAVLEQEYVPHGLIPGEWGEYVHFKIDANGVITNWPKKPSVCDFYDDED
jgi:hypothetical protein